MINLEQNNEFLTDLRALFPINIIKWRVVNIFRMNQGGELKAVVAPYIDSRELMNRFDNVLGGKWSCCYNLINSNNFSAVECTISVTINGETMSRSDVADVEANPSFGSSSALKTGYSNAFKRASIAWGVGRFLYSLENQIVPISQDNRGDYKINGQYKINNESTYVKGSFNVSKDKVMKELRDKGFDVSSIAISKKMNTSSNSSKQTNSSNQNEHRNEEIYDDEIQIDKTLMLARRNIVDLINSMGHEVDAINPLLKAINPEETSINNSSVATLGRLYNGLQAIKKFSDYCLRKHLKSSEINVMLSNVTKKKVDSLLDVVFDIEDESIKNALNERLQALNIA